MAAARTAAAWHRAAAGASGTGTAAAPSCGAGAGAGAGAGVGSEEDPGAPGYTRYPPPPSLPTVAPTRAPTVHSPPPSLAGVDDMLVGVGALALADRGGRAAGAAAAADAAGGDTEAPPPPSLLLPLHVSLLYTHSLLLLVPFPGIALRAGARRSALRGVGRAAGAIPRGQHDGQNCKVAAVPWRRHRCRRTTRPHCAPRAGRCGGPRRAHPRRQGVPPKPPKAGGYTPRQCAANNPRGGEAHRWRRAQVARWSTCARRSTPRSRSRPPPTS